MLGSYPLPGFSVNVAFGHHDEVLVTSSPCDGSGTASLLHVSDGALELVRSDTSHVVARTDGTLLIVKDSSRRLLLVTEAGETAIAEDVVYSSWDSLSLGSS